MCGIVGWVDFLGGNPPAADTIDRMARVITHRGPDDQGVYLDGPAALAARRLAIVDLAGGHQPLCNEDGSLWVTFNGEIYNHNELRETLTRQGHVFRTRCDTEVLVHLFEQHGESMPARLEGQFSFAIWDTRRRRLFAARDRCGVRPFFYARPTDGLLIFASEIKAILASGRVQASLDPKGLDHFVHFLHLIDERTMFRGVKALPPGHTLTADAHGVTVREYWDLDFPPAEADRTPSQRETVALADRLEALLSAAVDKRMRTEVPFAGYLSGGVDSSLIAKFINDRSAEPVPTFTATFRKRFFNEAREASGFASKLGSRATYVDCRAEVLSAAYPRVIYHNEAPVIDTSCAAVYELARAVRAAGFKVVLTGEGADEAMAGYIFFKAEKARRMLAAGPVSWLTPALASLQQAVWGTSFLMPDPAQRALADKVFGCMPDRWDEFFFLRRLRSLFSKDVLAELGGWEAWEDVPARWRDRVAGRHPLNQSLYLAYRMRLAGALMTEKGDRQSMAHSVEGRYPFLDTDLVEFAAKVPTGLKLRGWQEKYLLRRVAERHLPRSVAWRIKKMLMAPFSETFCGGPGPLADELLSPEAVREARILDPAKVAELRAAYATMRGPTPAGLLTDLGLVFAVGVQLWHRAFVQGRVPA